MLIPLILLCLEKSIQKPSIKYVLINGVLLALLTLAFPQVLPLLVGPFLVLYIVLRVWWERRRGIEYLKNVAITSAAALCLCLLLTAFWWLPLTSEMRYSFATSFSMEEAKLTSATFLQAITLRPSMCCAPSSAYGSAGSVILEILRTLPFILVLIGIILNRRNRYVWFFSIAILAAVLLAMGPECPINVFGLAHRYAPFFGRLRTPVRFLLFACIAYSVLVGFCVQALADRLAHLHIRKLRVTGMSFSITILVGLIVVGNTWQETRTAFGTFSLRGDQEDALLWLAEQEDGDYRIADPPFDPYVYDTKAGYIIRPTFWTYLHGKETLYGPGLSMAVKYTASALESLNSDIQRGPFDMSQWLSAFNVKFVLLDKTNTLSSNVVLDNNFEIVWPSDTIDIYENHAFKPRMFSVTATGERPVSLHAGDTINLTYAEGTQQPQLSLSSQHTMSSDLGLMCAYSFSSPSDYACLEAEVGATVLQENDAIHLVYYSDDDIPDVHLSLELVESDGSRYDVVLGAVDGIKAGWNEVNFPISLLTLRYSGDENAKLDLDQIDKLWIGAGRQGTSYKSQEFDLYFDNLSIVTQETNTNVEYTKIRPGKYKVHVSSDSPTCLVLSESYHPNWVARANGKTVHSQVVYQALNGFYLEAGEYDVTLDFAISPLRIAGNVITGVTVCILCLLGVYLLAKRWQDKRRPKSTPTTTRPPQS